jgi:hypothetical protein
MRVAICLGGAARSRIASKQALDTLTLWFFEKEARTLFVGLCVLGCLFCKHLHELLEWGSRFALQPKGHCSNLLDKHSVSSFAEEAWSCLQHQVSNLQQITWQHGKTLTLSQTVGNVYALITRPIQRS